MRVFDVPIVIKGILADSANEAALLAAFHVKHALDEAGYDFIVNEPEESSDEREG